MSDLPEVDSYSRLSILVNAAIAVVATGGVLWWASGFAVDFETLFRVSPTVEGGGIGADFVAGNSVGWLNAMITVVHVADVVMGAFILLMVFIHWGAFRRLAAQMRPPGTSRSTSEEAVTDGGREQSTSTAAGDVESGGDR
jgi:hypothetical protein